MDLEPRRCQFCGCTPNEPCWDAVTNWRCSQIAEDLCSMCVDEEIAGFELEVAQPSARMLRSARIDSAFVVPVKAAYL